MTTYTRPVVSGTPTTGQVVKAAHVNEPVDQIYDTILAGGITADQIAAGAVDTSELATAAVTAAKMDGTLPDTSAMATSAAPTTDAQLANKKYVDDQIAANVTPFGLVTNEDDDGNAMLKAHAYLANQDGFITAYVTASSSGNNISGYVDSDTNPASGGTLVGKALAPLASGIIFLSFPVQSGKYFELTTDSSGAVSIFWHPVGTLVKPTDQD